MKQKLVIIFLINAILVGLSAGRVIDLIFMNTNGQEVKLGDIRLEESKHGNSQESPGLSCLDIKQKGLDHGDGLYWISAGGGKAFQAYCDMTSFGGGWTMCYTTNDKADPADATTYNPANQYGTNGYRSNCNNIPFNEILFIDEDTNKAAYFKRQAGTKIKAADHYDKSANTFGLWESQRLASTSVKYQLLICNHSFYSGFMVSGYTNCYKQCDNWCSDKRTPYFRTSSTHSAYSGVAFNINGHSPNKPPKKLMSVGLR